MAAEPRVPTDALLDEMQWEADPHADAAVATVLGSWTCPRGGAPAASAKAAAADPQTSTRLQRIDALNAVIRGWKDNA